MRRLLARALLAASIGIAVIAMSATAADMTTDDANSIKLNLLKYREANSKEELAKPDERWDSTRGNYYLNPNAISGFRPDNVLQQALADSASTADPPVTEYPVKTQFLVIATVPPDATEVTWNLSGHEADVYGVPPGSRWIDGSHLVTPVAGVPIDGVDLVIDAVPIENPQYAAGSIQMRSTWAGEVRNGLERALEAKEPVTEHVAFYDTTNEDGVEVDPRPAFPIARRQTYIVITSSDISDPDDTTDVTDIVASCNTADPREATVYAAVSWIPQKPVGGVYAWEANLLQYETVNLAEGDAKVVFYVQIKNTGPLSIPTDLFAFGMTPTLVDDAESRTWWWWATNPPRPETPNLPLRWAGPPNPADPRWGTPPILRPFHFVSLNKATTPPKETEVATYPTNLAPGHTIWAKITAMPDPMAFDPNRPFQRGMSAVYAVGPRTTSDTTAKVVYNAEDTTVIPEITKTVAPDPVTELTGGVARLRNASLEGVGGAFIDVHIDGQLAARRILPTKWADVRVPADKPRVEVSYQIEVRDAEGNVVLGDVTKTFLAQ